MASPSVLPSCPPCPVQQEESTEVISQREPQPADDQLTAGLGEFYFDHIQDLSVYLTNGWQHLVHPGYIPGCTYQTLPVVTAMTLPPLLDFPVTAQLGEPTAELTHPYERKGCVRRDSFLFFYLPVDCPAGQRCTNWFCPFSHSSLEKMFHPLIYRTEVCRRGEKCRRRQCSFLHSPDDDMEATNLWFLWEQHWSGYRKKLVALTSLIDHLCTEPKDQDRVHSNMRVVLGVRLIRSTPEEREFAAPLVQNEDIVSPFYARILRQPLNALLIHPSMQELHSHVWQALSHAPADVVERFIAKTEALSDFYLDIIERCKEACIVDRRQRNLEAACYTRNKSSMGNPPYTAPTARRTSLPVMCSDRSWSSVAITAVTAHRHHSLDGLPPPPTTPPTDITPQGPPPGYGQRSEEHLRHWRYVVGQADGDSPPLPERVVQPKQGREADESRLPSYADLP